MLQLLLCLLALCIGSPALASGGHDHHDVPTLKDQTTTTVTIQGNAVTLMFGPIDLPTAHEGELASSIPGMTFSFPKICIWWGIKPRSSPKQGIPSPKTISITSLCSTTVNRASHARTNRCSLREQGWR